MQGKQLIVVVGTIEGVVVGAVAIAVDVELTKAALCSGNAGRIDGGAMQKAQTVVTGSNVRGLP